MKKYALLVVDIQNDYCHPKGKMSKAGKKIFWLQKTAGRIDAFIKDVDCQKVEIFYIRTQNRFNLLSDFEKAKQRKNKIAKICETGTWGADFYLLQAKKNIINKKHYSAFFGTNLNQKLKKAKITHLIVIGTSTHICIDATVKDAYQHGYDITVLKDLVATREEEINYHETTLKLISEQFGKVLSSKQFKRENKSLFR